MTRCFFFVDLQIYTFKLIKYRCPTGLPEYGLKSSALYQHFDSLKRSFAASMRKFTTPNKQYNEEITTKPFSDRLILKHVRSGCHQLPDAASGDGRFTAGQGHAICEH